MQQQQPKAMASRRFDCRKRPRAISGAAFWYMSRVVVVQSLRLDLPACRCCRASPSSPRFTFLSSQPDSQINSKKTTKALHCRLTGSYRASSGHKRATGQLEVALRLLISSGRLRLIDLIPHLACAHSHLTCATLDRTSRELGNSHRQASNLFTHSGLRCRRIESNSPARLPPPVACHWPAS